jgi:hypothetical protein
MGPEVLFWVVKFSQNVKNKIEKLGIFWCNINSLFSLKKITRFWVTLFGEKN